jgi:hypothetical protein
MKKESWQSSLLIPLSKKHTGAYITANTSKKQEEIEERREERRKGSLDSISVDNSLSLSLSLLVLWKKVMTWHCF